MASLLLLGGTVSALLQQVRQDSPYGYWPLDEISGLTAFDRSGNGRNGTWTAAPVFNSGGIAGFRYVSVGTQYLDGPTITPGANISLELWTRALSTTVNKMVFAWNTASAVDRIGMHPPYGDGNLYFDYGNITSGQGRISGVWPGGTAWNHVVCVATATTRRVYFNGALTFENTAASSAPTATSRAMRLVGADDGSAANDQQMNLAHMAVYQSELSVARVRAHYEAGVRSGASY